MSRLRTLLPLWLCIVVMSMFTAACSTNFFYRHMDWLLIRFVEGYVKLDESQQQHVRADFIKVSAALEQSVLPDLQALLDSLAEDNQRERMAINLSRYMQQIETLYKRAARLAVPGIAELALSLDGKQREQLFQEFARRDQKFRRKYIVKGEAHARLEHLRLLRKNTRKWIGKIGTEQHVALRTYDEAYQPNEQHWLESRQRWQAELQRVLDLPTGDRKAARLDKLLLQPQDIWTRQYRNIAEQNRDASIALSRQLANQMNARQRAQFARQLGKNQEKLDSFAQAIASARTPETVDQQSSLSAAKAALPPADLPHTVNSH